MLLFLPYLILRKVETSQCLFSSWLGSLPNAALSTVSLCSATSLHLLSLQAQKYLQKLCLFYHFIQIKCHIKCHNVVYTWPTFHNKQWCFFRARVTLINSCCPEKTTLTAYLLFTSLLRVSSSFHLHHEQEKRKERKNFRSWLNLHSRDHYAVCAR